jgi:hypothetical protein
MEAQGDNRSHIPHLQPQHGMLLAVSVLLLI